MASSPASTASSTLPWWASGGSEVCPYCLQLYHYELEVRCADCDAPFCPSCASRLAVEVIELHCPDCGAGDPTEPREEG